MLAKNGGWLVFKEVEKKEIISSKAHFAPTQKFGI